MIINNKHLELQKQQITLFLFFSKTNKENLLYFQKAFHGYPKKRKILFPLTEERRGKGKRGRGRGQKGRGNPINHHFGGTSKGKGREKKPHQERGRGRDQKG